MRISAPLAALLLGWLLLLASPAPAQPPPAGPPAVGVVRAQRTPITETNEFIGRVESINRVALVARVTAFLDKRLFTEGTEVKQGDLLYRLEQPPFQADLEAKQAALGQANALLTYATLTLNRAQSLLHTPAGSQSNTDNALAQQRSQAAQVLAAEANLHTAQINLGYTEIRAPIDGKISRTAVTEGNVVSPSSGTLATIVSQDPMYVVFPISSRAAIGLRDRYAGHGGFDAVRVRIRLPGGQIYGQAGRFDYIDPTVSATTDTLTARAVLANPLLAAGEGGKQGVRELIDGEFVQVLVEGLTPIEVLGVPRAAVLSDQQGDYVFTVDAENRAQQTRVQLGQSTPATAAIVSGLTEGARVITDGIQRVRPGMKVAPGPAAPGPGGVAPDEAGTPAGHAR
jgi:membrane fusion protein (multidrug efflux system)